MKKSLYLLVIFLTTAAGAFAASPTPISKVVVDGKEYPVYAYFKDVKAESRENPVYPARAKQEGRGGDTLVGAVIGEKGKVSSTFVAKSTADRDIQQAACAAVKQWKFPKLKDADKPITYVLFILISMNP
jgi:TonB family protein